MTTDLALRAGVSDLCRAFADAEATVRTSFAMLHAATERLDAAFRLSHHTGVDITVSRHHQDADFSHPDATSDRMARQAWSIVCDRLSLKRVLSTSRWNELQARLEKGPLPPFNEGSVWAFAGEYQGDLAGLFAEKVRETFELLTPQRGDFKTNSRLEICERVILARGIEPWNAYDRGSFRVAYRYSQDLSALEGLFRELDGMGARTRGHTSDLETAIAASKDGRGVTDYFEFRACKKGSLHLRILRADLRQKLNMIAGGKRLRPTEAA